MYAAIEQQSQVDYIYAWVCRFDIDELKFLTGDNREFLEEDLKAGLDVVYEDVEIGLEWGFIDSDERFLDAVLNANDLLIQGNA